MLSLMMCLLFGVLLPGCSEEEGHWPTPPNPYPICSEGFSSEAVASQGTVEIIQDTADGSVAPLAFIGDTFMPCEDKPEFYISGMIGQLSVEEYYALSGYKVINVDAYCRELGYDGFLNAPYVEYTLEWATVRCYVDKTTATVKADYEFTENTTGESRCILLYFQKDGQWGQFYLCQTAE